VFLFLKLILFNGAFVTSSGGVADLWVFPARGALGGTFLHGQSGWEAQKSMVCDFPYHSNAQSLNWPACKELQIAKLSAREGLLFCFGEFCLPVRGNHQFPTPAPFSFSVHCKFKSGVLRSQMWGLLALSKWYLATAL
jgi:hypothetical protein